jgi:hypothetical protein
MKAQMLLCKVRTHLSVTWNVMFKHYGLKGFDNSMQLVILVAELLPLYSIPNRTYSPTFKDPGDGVLH